MSLSKETGSDVAKTTTADVLHPHITTQKKQARKGDAERSGSTKEEGQQKRRKQKKRKTERKQMGVIDNILNETDLDKATRKKTSQRTRSVEKWAHSQLYSEGKG